VNIIEHNIESDREKEREMFLKSGRKGVPFIDIEGIYLHGFSDGSIREAVERRRSSQ
jgi:hypothetical protein